MTLVSYDFTSSIPGGVTVNSSPAGFAKTSSGSLTSFSANAGRRTDLGLLIEPSATNLWLSNIDQSTGQWSSPSLGTVTQNNATAPDGTTTADSYLETASNGQHCPYPAAAISVSGSTNYTTSAYVKSTGGRHAYIQIANQSFSVASVAFFDLTNGVATVGTALAGGGFSGQSAGIESAGGSWWRIWFTVTTGSGTTALNPFIGPCTGTGPSDSRIYTGDTSKGLIQWGNEIKVGTAPSSLIVTTTTSATRAADDVSFTIPAGVNQLKYTFDDNSTQIVSVSSGSYTIPTTLNRAQIKSIVSNEISATASQTTAAPSKSETAAVKIAASASKTTPSPTQSATAAVKVSAVAAKTTSAPSQSATFAVKVSASSSKTTAAPAQSATAIHTGASLVASQTTAAPGQAAAAAVQVGASASQAVQAPSAAETASVALSAAQNATTAVPSQSATAAHVAFASATQVTALPSQVATFGLAVPRECLADQLTASPQTAASAAVLVLAGTTQELLMPSAAAHVGWAHAEAPHGNDRLWNAGRTSRVVAGIRNNQRTTPYAPAAPPAPAPAVETSVSLWRAGRTARVVSKVRSTVAERALSPLPDQDRQASAAANQNCLPPDQTAVVNLF